MSISQGYCTIILYPWVFLCFSLYIFFFIRPNYGYIVVWKKNVYSSRFAWFCSLRYDILYKHVEKMIDGIFSVLYCVRKIKFFTKDIFIAKKKMVTPNKIKKNFSQHIIHKIWSKVNYRLQLFYLLLNFPVLNLLLFGLVQFLDSVFFGMMYTFHSNIVELSIW